MEFKQDKYKKVRGGYSRFLEIKCEKCGSLDSFMQLPEDVLKSREEDIVEEEVQITAPVKRAKAAIKSSSTKSKAKTAKRSKKK